MNSHPRSRQRRHTRRHLHGQTDSITQLKNSIAARPDLSAVENVKNEAYSIIECENNAVVTKTGGGRIQPKRRNQESLGELSSVLTPVSLTSKWHSDCVVRRSQSKLGDKHRQRCESDSTYSVLLGVRWDDSSYAAEWRCIYISHSHPSLHTGRERQGFLFIFAFLREIRHV